MLNSNESITALLIGHNAARAAAVRSVLLEDRPAWRMDAMTPGKSALHYLRQEGPHAKAPRCDLVLLDLVEARKTDLTLLQQIKADGKLADIPLVLLTTAKSEQAIADSNAKARHQLMFSAIGLERFLKTMRASRPERFLNALRLIDGLGYVPVRLPQL